MAVTIHRLTGATAGPLATVADDVFDEDITPDRLGPFLAAPGHVMFAALDGREVVGRLEWFAREIEGEV